MLPDCRIIDVSEITEAVRSMCIESNYVLPHDVSQSLEKALRDETDCKSRIVLGKLLENRDVAQSDRIPLCQDTGMAVFFVEVGQNVRIVGGLLTDAMNEGVRLGYKDGLLRNSVVGHPLSRKNTGDNTPAVIHYDVVAGDCLKITFCPKGFGSENMSSIKMLSPADGLEGVLNFIVSAVEKAGSNPCPPVIVGVGVGGNFEKSAILAKKALTLPLDFSCGDEFSDYIESEAVKRINSLGIGVMGLGGSVSCLGVKVLTYPTHIAGLPVAVNISCHASRHRCTVI